MLHSDLTEGKHSAYCASASTFGPAPSEPQERRWQRPKMRPPAVPDQPIPLLSEPQLRTLFAACAGKDFDARRDTALLMVLLDAGPRRAELLGMRVEDLDFEYDVVRVIGKGRRERALPFGRKTAMALDAICAPARATGGGSRPPRLGHAQVWRRRRPTAGISLRSREPLVRSASRSVSRSA